MNLGKVRRCRERVFLCIGDFFNRMEIGMRGMCFLVVNII